SPDQYRAWITTGTIPDRTGLAEAAIHGGGPFDAFDPFPFIQQHSDPTNARTLARDLANHLLPLPVTEADVDGLVEILLEGAPAHEWIVIYVNTPETARARLRALLTHLANLPEFQLT
ncbi:MAG TPA: hypothetical protein VD962_09880, partial [Rubricoccaceae bacterium]|nr:hypothetical protein [Rubricoccaceae bacterium]